MDSRESVDFEKLCNLYFELSSTGTLYVTAQDRATGQRAQATFDLNQI